MTVLLGVCLCRYVMLNNKQRLMMPSDTELPVFEPVHLAPGSKVMLAPLTFGFFVFPEADVKICYFWRHSVVFMCSWHVHMVIVICSSFLWWLCISVPSDVCSINLSNHRQPLPVSMNFPRSNVIVNFCLICIFCICLIQAPELNSIPFFAKQQQKACFLSPTRT